MVCSLLEGIDRHINSHSAETAILYYDGKCWISVTYDKLRGYLQSVEGALHEIIPEKSANVLLYLKVTCTYPVLILSILKANLSFICIEDGDLDLLTEFVINQKVNFIFTNNSFAHKSVFEDRNYIKLKVITLLGEDILIWDTQNDRDQLNELEYLYSIKTSGTTGLGKVVQVPHSCIFPNVKDLSGLLSIKNDDTILFMTPVTFDPSIIELFLAFYNGCSICILEKHIKEDPQKMVDVLFPCTGGMVSILQTTPSLLKRWNLRTLKEKIFHKNSSLKALLLGGEEFPNIQEVLSWNVADHISLYNIYGITEVSCWATIKKVLPSQNPSNDIGKPLSETIIKLKDLNKNNEGELLIGSETRKCLVGGEERQDISKEEVLFRSTGDIFKDNNGKLFFIGRKDDVVKRWGSRFSLSEIEKITLDHENTAACCCIGVPFESHYKVSLFVVQKIPSPLKNLEVFLRKRLSSHAWPDMIHVLSSFPLTKHGKLCKKTLKNICTDDAENDKKQIFNNLWASYTDECLEGDNFFLSGGNSFTALQFFNELKRRFNDIPDTFLGMLMQNKSKDELLSIFFGLISQVEPKLAQETFNKTVHCAQQNPASEVCNHNPISVWKTYLKGKENIGNPIHKSVLEVINMKSLKIEELWKHNLGKCVDASPLGIKLADNKSLVIIGSHSGLVVVLDIDKNDVISSCTLPNIVESSACIADSGNVYYLGCHDGCLYCISVGFGSIDWKFQTDDIIKSTAVIYKGNIIFGSYDTHLYSLTKDGRVNWKTKLKSPILTEAIVDRDTVYSATFGSIAALNVETGQLLMEIDSLPIFSTPIITDKHLVVANVKGKLMWLNRETAVEDLFFLSEDLIYSSLVKVTQEMIIFGCCDACVYCLKNRKLFWKTALDSKVVSTPFVKMENSSGFVICFTSTGKGYLLNLTSGDKIHEYILPHEVFSSPIIVDEKVIVGCRDDNVHILKLV